MKLRLKLVTIILRNSRVLLFIPIIMVCCILPLVSGFKYFYANSSEARSIFIYLAQVLIPLCGLLWPMGYIHVWVEGDGCEALRACTIHHKTCIGEVFLLSVGYLVMVIPIIIFAVFLFQITWLEYVRLFLQYGIVIHFFYFTVMLLRNVTLGSIPIIAYLLFCFYISGSADFASFSIIEPNYSAEFSRWSTLLALYFISLLFFLIGYLMDRYGRKYN